MLPREPLLDDSAMEDHSIRSDEKKKILFLKLRTIYSDVYKYNLTVYNLRTYLFSNILKGPPMGLRGNPGIPNSQGLTGSICFWLAMTKEDLGEIKEMLKDERSWTFTEQHLLIFLNSHLNALTGIYNELLKIRTSTYVARVNYMGGLCGLPGSGSFKSDDFNGIIEACLKLIIEIEEDLDALQGLVFPKSV